MEPTDPGISNSPTHDAERRRSVRIASRVNIQHTDQSREQNNQSNTSIQQSTTRPKIILHVNRQNHQNPDQGNLDKDSEYRDVNMVDSTNEPPRKIRRSRGDTTARHSRDPVGPAEGSGFNSAVGASTKHSTSMGSAAATIGRGDRSGYTGPPMAPSPSHQQSAVLGRRETHNQGSQSARTEGRRVPGMPTPMPRSDTPPPSFDMSNPYSAFSQQPAIPQRRPLVTAGPSTLPTSLPSLPSDEALTEALQGSVQSQDVEGEAQAKADHRDPSWRHPWGIPIEPLPPALARYIPARERASNMMENMRSAQANDESEEFHGLDEHIPLGDHPLDLEFVQSWMDLQREQENEAPNYMESEENYIAGLAEIDNFYGDSRSIPYQSPSSGVQPAATNTGSAAPSIQIAGTNSQSALSNTQAAFSNTQPSAPNTYSAASSIHSTLQAGDTNVFPEYPYGFDLPVPNPTTNQAVKQASVGNALMLLTDQAEALVSQGADDEDVRRASLAASIMGSLVSENAKVQMAKAKGKGPAHQQPLHNYQPQPEFKDLALGRVKVGKVSPTGQPTCTFCKYPCDWGISEDRFRLPEEASSGSCHGCSNPNVGSFYDEFTTILQSRTDQASKDALEKVQKEVMGPELLIERGPKVYSATDGTDITKFMGPMFCKSCPWGQIDVEKVRICDTHRDEKFAIIKHRCHQEFHQIGYAMPGEEISADKLRGMNMNDAEDRVRDDVAQHHELNAKHKAYRRCMICTNHATDVCAGCPLRLCGTCVAFLKNLCKGYLDNLFYHYERDHLRNDAFLLRSDGGGF